MEPKYLSKEVIIHPNHHLRRWLDHCITTNSYLVPSTPLKFKHGLLGASTHLRGGYKTHWNGDRKRSPWLWIPRIQSSWEPILHASCRGRGNSSFVPLQPRQTFMRLETCLVQIISQAQPGWPVIWGSQKIGAAMRLYWSYSVRKYRGVVHVRDWITTPMPKWPCLNAKWSFHHYN